MPTKRTCPAAVNQPHFSPKYYEEFSGLSASSSFHVELSVFRAPEILNSYYSVVSMLAN